MTQSDATNRNEKTIARNFERYRSFVHPDIRGEELLDVEENYYAGAVDTFVDVIKSLSALSDDEFRAYLLARTSEMGAFAEKANNRAEQAISRHVSKN